MDLRRTGTRRPSRARPSPPCTPLRYALASLLALVSLTSLACDRRIDIDSFGRVPNFALTTHTGESFTQNELRTKVSIINFIFTSCQQTCPLLTKKMAGIQKAVQRQQTQIQLLSITVDPSNDTPDALAAYATAHDVRDSNWKFLTGDAAEVKRVVVQSFHQGMAEDPTHPENILHGSHFVLVDKHGTIRGFYPSEPNDDKDIHQIEGMVKLVEDALLLVMKDPR